METRRSPVTWVRVKRLHPNAWPPEYATPGASAMDLFAVEDAIITYGHVTHIRTGIAMEIPVGFEGQIRPRSGLAAVGLMLMPSVGTIDSDYRGEIMVGMIGLWPEADYRVMQGDRIAQMAICPVFHAHLILVDELSGTGRGAGGFGSTGR